MEDGPFNPFEDDEETKIIFEAMVGPLVIMFRALQKQGLTGQEAAALTAAIFAQNVPSVGRDNGQE